MVLGLVEALLGQVELGPAGGQFGQLFPLLFGGRLLGQGSGRGQVSQLDSQVKLVFGVCANGQGLFLESLLF